MTKSDWECLRQRQEVLRAYIAKYGLDPEDTVQVMEAYSHHFDGPRWYLTSRSGHGRIAPREVW